MRPSLEEQETIIRIGRTEEYAEICTSDLRYITKLDRLVKNSPDWTFVRQEVCEGDIVEKFYRCPVSLVSLRSKKAVGRKLSEEQKREKAEIFRRYRESQN